MTLFPIHDLKRAVCCTNVHVDEKISKIGQYWATT